MRLHQDLCLWRFFLTKNCLKQRKTARILTLQDLTWLPAKTFRNWGGKTQTRNPKTQKTSKLICRLTNGLDSESVSHTSNLVICDFSFQSRCCRHGSDSIQYTHHSSYGHRLDKKNKAVPSLSISHAWTRVTSLSPSVNLEIYSKSVLLVVETPALAPARLFSWNDANATTRVPA